MTNKLMTTLILTVCMVSCSQNSSYTLKWKTASEFQNYGYDIYRGFKLKGPFTKITETPILGAGTTDLISEYIYTDENLKQGVIYYYYIESISIDGKRKRFTPVKPIAVDE